MNKITLYIFTPETPIVENKEVAFVALPAYAGEMGVLPGHTRAMALLKEGSVRYKTSAGAEEKFDISGGFVEILNDVVEVFAESAALGQQLESEEARQEKAKKKNIFAKDADLNFELAEFEIKKSIAELRKKNKPF